jgi:hypothetical protein
MVVEVTVVRLDASFVFVVEWGMGDCVWLKLGIVRVDVANE